MIDNNTEQEIIKIINDELANYDYSAYESEEEFKTTIDGVIDSNIFGLILGAFGCDSEDSNRINELFKNEVLNKYQEYKNSLIHDNTEDEDTVNVENTPKAENTPKQNYCEYICNDICNKAAKSGIGYTPNTSHLTVGTINKLHNITRGYFIDSFMKTKSDYIINTPIKELQGLYDTLFDFAAHIYNK